MFGPLLILLSTIYYKCALFVMGLYHLAFSQDKKVNLPGYNPGLVYSSKTVQIKKTKTLIIIRHAESVWNEIFNRNFDWGFPLRLLTGIFCELVLFVTNDSYFFDSPLSDRGIKQASDLHQFIKSITENDLSKDLEKSWKGLTGKQSNSESGNGEKQKKIPIVTSPLRRCVETACLGLFARLQQSSEQKVIYTHSCLQELTGNFDGMSLAKRARLAPLSSTFDILKGYFTLTETANKDYESDKKSSDEDQSLLQSHQIQSNLRKINHVLENDYKVNLSGIKNTVETQLQGLEIPDAIKENVQKVSANLNLDLPDSAKQKIQETSNRLKQYQDSLLSSPSLGAISASTTTKNELTNLSTDYSSVKNWKAWITERIEASFTDGAKPTFKRGDKRLDAFVHWLFLNKATVDEDIVVICGHSNWLKSFFKSYLPRDVRHVAKTHKIQNCGIIQCQITQFVETQDPSKKNRYCIDPESIKVVKGGFQNVLTKL